MYEVKWMPKTAVELEELCNKATEYGFELVACNDTFCVFIKSAQKSVQRIGLWERIKKWFGAIANR